MPKMGLAMITNTSTKAPAERTTKGRRKTDKNTARRIHSATDSMHSMKVLGRFKYSFTADKMGENGELCQRREVAGRRRCRRGGS